MVLVSDSRILDEGFPSGLIIFCVVRFDSTIVVWVVVGDSDVFVTSS